VTEWKDIAAVWDKLTETEQVAVNRAYLLHMERQKQIPEKVDPLKFLEGEVIDGKELWDQDQQHFQGDFVVDVPTNDHGDFS